MTLWTAVSTPIDLDLARAGYLVSAEGCPRYIYGLDRIAGDIAAADARVSWHELPGALPGICDWQARRIYLAPWLWRAWPWWVRRVLAEELAHCVLGPSETRAHHWQAHHYGDVIRPPLAWIA